MSSLDKVHEELRSKGYSPKDWISAEKTPVIEALNPFGNTVFIELDSPTYKSKTHRYTITDEEVVPQEVIDKVNETVHLLTGGLVYHENTMCIINNGEMTQYVCKPSSRALVPKTAIYPFVHISDIREKPALSEHIDLVSTRIHNERFRDLLYSLHNMNESYIAFQEEAERFYVDSDSILSELITSTTKHRDEIGVLAKNNSGSPEHLSKQQSLHRRERFLTNLEREISDSIRSQAVALKSMSEKIKSSREILEKEYSSLGQ